MNKVLVYTHQGLGDQIECVGMIRHIADIFDEVHILSKSQHEDTVRYIYRDDSNVKVHVIPPSGSNEYGDERQWVRSNLSNFDGTILTPGHENYFNNIQDFNRRQVAAAPAFYEIIGVPYELKFEKFYFQRERREEDRVYKKLNPHGDKYIFVHDDASRGFSIDVETDYKIIRNDISENVFHMTKIFENAEEVHCMSSSMFCLIDCMAASPLLETNLNQINKFLHWNVRRVFLGNGYLGADNWKVLR